MSRLYFSVIIGICNELIKTGILWISAWRNMESMLLDSKYRFRGLVRYHLANREKKDEKNELLQGFFHIADAQSATVHSCGMRFGRQKEKFANGGEDRYRYNLRESQVAAQ